MNLADLTAVIIAIFGCVSGPIAAHEMNSVWWHYPILLTLGVIIAFILAFVSGRFSYFLLESDHQLAFVAYPIFSLVAMITSGGVIIFCTFEVAQFLVK